MEQNDLSNFHIRSPKEYSYEIIGAVKIRGQQNCSSCYKLISLVRGKTEILFYALKLGEVCQGCTAKKVFDPAMLEIMLASFMIEKRRFPAL